MRTWILIAALAVICVSSESQHFYQKEEIRSILRTWNPRKDLNVFNPIDHVETDMRNEFEFTDTSSHRISKRSVSPIERYSSVSRGCNLPGFTGETCQYPICSARNPYIPNDASEDQVVIDASNLANCSTPYILLIDESLYEITIEVETESPLNPTFYLQYEDGSLIQPDNSNQRSTSFTAKYLFLAPGQYLVGPRADTGEEFCTLMVSSRTKLKVSGGFVSGDQAERNDFPTLKYAYFGVQSNVVLHAQGLEYPGKIDGVGFTGAENHISRYIPLGIRYNCTYPYLLERYTCQRRGTGTTGYFFLQVEGITNSGYKFRRIVNYNCILPPQTTTLPATAPPTTPSITSCKNGGSVLTDPNGQSYCYCFGYFAGPDCGQTVCQNGGYLASPTSTRCTCPDGYDGFHCENIVCTDISGFDLDAEHPTLTFVIRTRGQLSDVITQITNAVNSIINTLDFDQDYLTSFIVVLFDNDKLLSSKKYPTGRHAMVDINKAIHTAHGDIACLDSVFSAVAAALSLSPNNKSPVYVITDAVPIDSQEKETVFQLGSYLRAPLYFLYIQPLPADGCNTSPDNSAYRDMVDISTRTSGNAFYFSDRTKIQAFMTAHLENTLYHSQLMLSGDYAKCGQQNLYKTIAVDLDTDVLVMIATAPANSQAVLVDPFGSYITPDTQYTDGLNYIWTKRGVVAGQWFFTLITPNVNDACSARVYQKKFNSAGSVTYTPSFDIFWGFASTLTSSGNLRQPVVGFDTAPVFHVSNYPQFIDMGRVHATLQIYAIRDGQQVEVYGSNGIFRDACEFPFYFPPFTCGISDETLYFNLFLRDRKEMTLQRAGVMYCTTFHPTPPPDHQCQNGGVINPSNSTCFCPPQFTGTYCQNIVCYNGGSVSGNMCKCPPGFAGENCELARCTQTGQSPEFNQMQVEMVFAVEITQQSIASLATFSTVFSDILRDVQTQNPFWIKNFVLVGFNSTWGGVIAESPSWNLSAIETAMHQIVSTVPSDTGCTVKLWDALTHVLFTRDFVPGSFIEVFQTSPEDDADIRNLATFNDLYRSRNVFVNGFVSMNPRNTPAGFACNATVDQYFTLFDIIGQTTGNVYVLQAAEISNAARIIPLQFSNGLVQFNFNDDCTHDDGLITYFPVDAYTQTIQVSVYGFNPTIQVFSGDGTLRNVLPLFHDEYTGLGVYEIRKPCDPDWDEYGQYCIKFVAGSDSNLPYNDAKKYCTAAGGFLSDDLNDDKNNFLYAAASKTQFWIGLYKDNSGTWVWDRGNGNGSNPLNQPNTYWADGEPHDDNQCVYFDGRSSNAQKTWTSDICATARAFVCQKHRYDVNNVANRISDDDLPAGLWYAKMKTAPNTGYPPLCSFKIHVQSALQIVAGYVTSVGDDFPEADPIQDSSTNRLATYVTSHTTRDRAPRMTDALIFDQNNGSFYNGLKYQERFGCQYQYISQDFGCPANEQFGVLHVGEDEYGNTFQRITLGHCSKAEITCGDGGIRQNGQCICNEYYTGSRCTVPICVNGGTRRDERYCDCPRGYTGPNCQYETCLPLLPTLFSNNGKSLVYVIEATKQNTPTINALIANLANIVTSATSSNVLWFNNYGLVTFDSSGRLYENYTFTSIQDLVVALTQQSLLITDQGSCNLPYLDVLGHLIAHDSEITIPNSQIFLITTAGPSDGSNYGNTMSTLFDAEAQLHVVYSKADNCPAFDSVQNVLGMTWLGYGSSGNILFTDANNIVNLLNAYTPTLYGSSILQNPTGLYNFTCSNGNSWYIPVDMNTTYIYVTTSSEFGSLSVQDPTGLTHQATVLYNSNEQKIYSIEVNRIAGIWTLQLTSPPGLCLAHVYSTGGAQVFTKFALTNPVGSVIDPTGAHQDGRFTVPVPGFENVAVFHLAGQPFHNGVLQYVEIFDGTGMNIMRSELYRRRDCSFEYFSDPFVCNSDMIVLFVHGQDEYNQKFRREEIVMCNGQAPSTDLPPMSTILPVTGGQSTQNPVTQGGQTTNVPITQAPPMTTQNIATTTSYGYTNLQFDIVFLIDGSQASMNNFDYFTKFIQTMMVSFNVGLNGARVGLLVVAPDFDDQSPPSAGFNSIGSQESLNSYLKDLKGSNTDFTHSGQILNYNLQVITSQDFLAPSNGYRTSIKNHLIVYITSTTAFDTDPLPTAQTIIAQKTYGFITIGYGNSVDNAKLTAIAGGNACAFTANNFANLNQNINAIQSLIWNADSNNGVYCGSN